MKTTVMTQFEKEEHLKQGYNALQIDVRYEKGGLNYFNGETTRQGMFIGFRPVQATETSTSFLMFDDTAFKVKICEAKRNNSKKIQAMFAIVEQHRDRLVELYKRHDLAAIQEFAFSLA